MTNTKSNLKSTKATTLYITYLQIKKPPKGGLNFL